MCISNTFIIETIAGYFISWLFLYKCQYKYLSWISISKQLFFHYQIVVDRYLNHATDIINTYSMALYLLQTFK